MKRERRNSRIATTDNIKQDLTRRRKKETEDLVKDPRFLWFAISLTVLTAIQNRSSAGVESINRQPMAASKNRRWQQEPRPVRLLQEPPASSPVVQPQELA